MPNSSKLKLKSNVSHTKKPLGGKSYEAIPHLPGSLVRLGDVVALDGMVRIATVQPRDHHDRVICSEKLDGTCVAVAKIHGDVVPLNRSGQVASLSPWVLHRMFAKWVEQNERRFWTMLGEGERVVGEWLAQAHGTIYDLTHEPFVCLDVIVEDRRHKSGSKLNRIPYDEMTARASAQGFTIPHKIHDGGPVSVAAVIEYLDNHDRNPYPHGAIDGCEGAVWRVERRGRPDFLLKYVRPCKHPNRYLPEVTGRKPVMLWTPRS